MTDPIEVRVTRRFKATLTEEKMKALLLKLRKGADSNVSMKLLIEALNYLGGWKVEPTVGLVQMHGYGPKEDKPNFEVDEDANHIQRLWEKAKQDEVRSFPLNPKHGQRYTMDVTEPSTWPAGGIFKQDRTGFYFKEWVGANCIRFTSPEGKVFEALPNKFDLARYSNPMKMPIWGVKTWLRKDTKFLEQVSNRLGMPTYEDERREKATPRTRDNTGTCPCCFRNIKLKARGNQHPVIVLHGYQRPGWGSVQGQCIGVDFPPFELSPEGTKHLVKMLNKTLDDQEDWLRKLKSGNVTELHVQQGAFGKPKLVTPETEGLFKWKQLIDSRISQTESLVHALKSDISMLGKLIADWKEQPLPKENEKAKPPPAFLRWRGAQDLSCGTTACALGWAATMPAFRRLGLRLASDYRCGGFVTLKGSEHLPYSGPEKVAKDIFGLDYDDFEFLFMPGVLPSDSTPKQVAKHIRRFVQSPDYAAESLASLQSSD